MVRDVVAIEGGLTGDGEYCERALAIYEELGNLPHQASALVNLGIHAYWEGRWQDAIDLFGRARTIFRTIGSSLGDADSTFNIGEILSQQGRLAEAEQHVREAARLWRAAGHAYAAVATAELGRIAYRAGRFPEAISLLEQAREEFVKMGADADVRETDIRIAECRLLMGDSGTALEIVDGALQEVERKGVAVAVRMPRLLRIRGCALILEDAFDEAHAVLARSVEASREEDDAYELALALEGLAHLQRTADPDGARGLEQERLDLLARLGIEAASTLPGLVGAAAAAPTG